MTDSPLIKMNQCPVCDLPVGRRAFSVRGSELLLRKNYNLTDEERAWLTETIFPVVHCTGCGLYFHVLYPSESLSNALYNRWISSDGSLEKIRQNPFGQLYFLSYFFDIQAHYGKLHSGMQGRSLLEVGCGWGKFLRMAQLFDIQASGIEYSLDKLTHVRSQGMTAYLPEELPNEEMFDIVAMLQVIEHIPKPFEFMCEYASRIRKGGVFIVEVPNCNYLMFRRLVYRLLGKELFGAYQPLEHVNCFTTRSLDRLMARLGFSPFKDSQRCVKTRLGSFCFRRPLVGYITEMLLGSTGRIYVRDNER